MPRTSSITEGTDTGCHSSGSGLRQREQILHQLVLTVHRLEDARHVLALGLRGWQIHLQQLHETTDRRQRRADLVGHAGGHPPEEGELIRAPDLLPDSNT